MPIARAANACPPSWMASVANAASGKISNIARKGASEDVTTCARARQPASIVRLPTIISTPRTPLSRVSSQDRAVRGVPGGSTAVIRA
ncbi:hypothetical protein [Xanthomonas sp. NCPPB 1128]|uniref:hypothetical protein n=1 Tax=Xanthomonas sp. NCPPB 1128 TaxID=1775876 RepID=UPI00103902BA|nr:hypothetical protein [Xanthomonas sp. NCPPB 1128]